LLMEAILETQAFYWLKRVTDIDVSKTQSHLQFETSRPKNGRPKKTLAPSIESV
jgi:hypothetical protein